MYSTEKLLTIWREIKGEPEDSAQQSLVLTHDMCDQLFRALVPMIQHLYLEGILKRNQGYVVVLNPFKPCPAGGYQSFSDRDLMKAFTEAVLFEYPVGDPKEHEYDFTTIALAKAFESWKSGLTTAEIHDEAPFLLTKSSVQYKGAVVRKGGLIVAFSGVQWRYDVAIAETFATWIVHMCSQQLADIIEASEKSGHDADFFGQIPEKQR